MSETAHIVYESRLHNATPDRVGTIKGGVREEEVLIEQYHRSIQPHPFHTQA